MRPARSAVRVAAVARRLAWWFLRPRTIGAQMVVTDEAGRVLLVRHSYERDVLRLPGGGARRHETLAECAVRELREETGLRVADLGRLELLGIYSGREGNQAAVIAVYVAGPDAWEGSPSTSAEIDAVQFHGMGDIPGEVSPATRQRLRELASGRRCITGRW